MAENQNISIRADSEPKAMPEATRRVEATREVLDVTEHVIYPKSDSELNAIMDFAKIALAQEDDTAIPAELFIQDGEIRVKEPEFERTVIKQTDELNFENLDATAAGLGAGGENGEGNSFVVLQRIHEDVTPVQYQYGYNPLTPPPIIEGVGVPQNTGTVVKSPDQPTVEKPVDKPPVEPPSDNNGDKTDDKKDESKDDSKEDVNHEEDKPDVPEDKGNNSDDSGDSSDNHDDDKTDPLPSPIDLKEHQDNGWGNGDDEAPGNSGPNNNAENNTSGKEDPTLKLEDLLVDNEHGNSGNSNSGGESETELLASLLSHGNENLLKGNPHVD